MSKTSLDRFSDPDLLESYRFDFGARCEASRYLISEDRARLAVMRKTNHGGWLELHHILTQPHYRVDNLSNIIMIDSVLHHAFGHHHYHTVLTCICLYAKFKKDEFVIYELEEACPFLITGKIARVRRKVQHQHEYARMCDEMLDYIRNL